jgi:PAS domain S-box-containing protein
VLLVEDSPEEAELIKHALEQHGFTLSMTRVWDARTMSAAMADGIWDVVVSDYMLPGFSGPKALELYRNQGLDIPFICISGKVGEEEAVGMIRAGAHDFVLKQHLERLPVVVEMELALAEKRRQQKRVARSVRHLAAIVDGTDDAIIGKDLLGTILSWNRAAEAMYGHTAEELIGENISTIVPPEKSREMSFILEKLREGRSVERLETQRLHKNGNLIDVSLTVSPICDDLGRVIGASSISRNISERRRKEQERLKLIEELQHALAQVKLLSGLLPICAHCKKIRDPDGLWHQLETFIHERSEASFTHSLCPECVRHYFPGMKSMD